MAGLFEIFFKVYAGIAKCIQRFRGRFTKCRQKARIRGDQAHSFAAAARDRFQQHRITHASREFPRVLRIFNGIIGTGDGGNFRAPRELASSSFCAERFHRFG